MSSAFGADPAIEGQSVPEEARHLLRPPSDNGKGDPARGNHVRVETVRGEHAARDPDQGEYAGGSPERGKHVRVEPERGKHVRVEPEWEPDRVEPEWESDRVEPMQGEPDREQLGQGKDASPGSAPVMQKGPSLAARLRQNHLVTNSLYLMVNSGLQAAAGFVFWIISARLFSVSDVGLATSLFSVLGVIAFGALLGLNSTVVRYLPRSSEPNVLMTASMATVAGCGALLTLGYLAIMPVVSPKLASVVHDPAMAAGVVLLGGICGPLNLITDSIFIGLRQAKFNALVDGGIGGAVKIVAAVSVAGAGAYGLFVASAIGYAAAAVASLVLLVTVNRFRPTLGGARAVLRPLWRFSAANYLGNLLTLLPTFVIPLIVLDRVGVHDAAYYYIAFLMVSLLFAGVFAVEQAFLSEGSHDDVELRAVMRRSWRLLALFCIPSTIVLILGARWLLLLFGHSYSVHGTDVLIVLATAAIPFAAFNWLLTVLRLIGRLRAIVVGNVAYAVLTCGLAWVLAPRGVVALSAAWPVGLTVACFIVGVPVWRWSRLPRPELDVAVPG
jgi:O-antigen/teichoic acid export membrane protein